MTIMIQSAVTPRPALLTLAAVILATSANTAAAAAPALTIAQPATTETIAVQVDNRRKHRIVKRRHNDDVEVDAPTTYVHSRRGKVNVEAPFTSVERSKRGVRVRAPFVDLWVPRR
ncbi:MAG: hypothetical protein ACK5KM_04165 [Hyphomicrobiaceae bacterium]